MKKIVYILAPFFLILFLLLPSKSWSQDNFIGEIRIYAGNRVPAGWVRCEGQILSISQFSALYAVIGNHYGGNGATTFALPDLRGNVVVGLGQASQQFPPNTTTFSAGTKAGTENIRLEANNLPAHQHFFRIYNGVGNTDIAAGAVLAVAQSLDLNAIVFPFSTQAPNTELNLTTLLNNQLNLPIDNLQPSVAVSYIIALQGYFPTRW